MQSDTTIPILNPKVHLLINQFRRENESRRRTLAFLIEEDIILKAGISEVLKNMNQTDGSTLKMLEHLHSRLIKGNDTVRLLGPEVAEMEKKLNRDFSDDANLLNSIKCHQSRLRNEIEAAEKEFLKLKFDLNDYIGGILQKES